MTDAMPGLKTFFDMFSVMVMKKFFLKEAPSIAGEIDWEETKEKLVEDIYANVSLLKVENENLFHKLYPILADIHMLQCKSKEWKVYYKRIDEEHRQVDFHKFFGTSVRPSIQDMVMWMKVEMPGVFSELLSRRLANKRNISGGNHYYLPTTYEGCQVPA